LFGADNDLKAPSTPSFFGTQSTSSMNLGQSSSQQQQLQNSNQNGQQQQQQQQQQQFPNQMQTGGAAGFGLFNNENFGLNPSLPVMATEFAPRKCIYIVLS